MPQTTKAVVRRGSSRYDGPPQKAQFADHRIALSSRSIIASSTTTTPPSFYTPMHTASSWQIPTNRKEVYAWCFHPDTIVMMSDFSQKHISEIKIGDKVLTGSGTTGTISRINIREFNGIMKKISVVGTTDYILST